MPTLDRDEVARVADLARIDLSDTEIDRLAGELQVIVASVEKVSEIATADVPATSHPVALVNTMREDVPEAPLAVEDVLAGAPESEGGKFAVPQILGEDA